MGRVREERGRRKRKSQKKEDPGAPKGRKVAKHCFSNDLKLRRVENDDTASLAAFNLEALKAYESINPAVKKIRCL